MPFCLRMPRKRGKISSQRMRPLMRHLKELKLDTIKLSSSASDAEDLSKLHPPPQVTLALTKLPHSVSSSYSSAVSGEAAKHPETSQDPPSEVVKSSTSGSDASEVLNGATNGEGSPSEPFSTCDLRCAKENELTLESKAEPDDWEDAAVISAPKLKISDDGKQLDEDLLTFSEQCNVLPINFNIGPDIADSLMSPQIAISHHVDRPSGTLDEEVENLILGTPGLSKPCPSSVNVKYSSLGTFDLNKVCPPASCIDVNAKANKLPDCPCEENSSSSEEEERDDISKEEFTSEDDDDSFRHPLMNYKYLFRDEVMSFKTSWDLMSSSVKNEVALWARTWEEPLDEPGVRDRAWIHVHAYYSNKKRHGGYGVIVCDALGKPIIAKGNFSKNGISFLYQVCKGISAGVELAEVKGYAEFHIGCNSRKFPSFFRSFKCTDVYCDNIFGSEYLCLQCENVFIVHHCGLDAAHFVQELRQKNIMSLNEPSFMAEHYIAKMEKKKILKGEMKEESSDGTIYHPVEFPPGLRVLVWTERLKTII